MVGSREDASPEGRNFGRNMLQLKSNISPLGAAEVGLEKMSKAPEYWQDKGYPWFEVEEGTLCDYFTRPTYPPTPRTHLADNDAISTVQNQKS